MIRQVRRLGRRRAHPVRECALRLDRDNSATGAAAATPQLFGMQATTPGTSTTRVSLRPSMPRSVVRISTSPEHASVERHRAASQGPTTGPRPTSWSTKRRKRNMQVLLVVRAAPQWANGSTRYRGSSRATRPGSITFVPATRPSSKRRFSATRPRSSTGRSGLSPTRTSTGEPRGLSPADQPGPVDRHVRPAVPGHRHGRAPGQHHRAALRRRPHRAGRQLLHPRGPRSSTHSSIGDWNSTTWPSTPHSIINQAPWNCIPVHQSFCDIQKMRDILVNRGRSNVKLWVTEFGWQVGGFTTTGTTDDQRCGSRETNTGSHCGPTAARSSVNGVARNYSSITRTTSYSDITPHESPGHRCRRRTPRSRRRQAEATQAAYVRESIRMLRGQVRPAVGKAASRTTATSQIAIYFRNYDAKTAYVGHVRPDARAGTELQPTLASGS